MPTPLQQRIVPFYSDELVAVQRPDGTIFMLFSRLCENLGLERSSQTRRVQRHAVLSKGLMALDIQTPGGVQSLQCLKLSLLPLWLSGVQASRIKSELQAQLIRYQEEVADVLWQAFKPQILIEAPPEERESALAIGQLEQIIEQSRAMQRMAEEQIALIRRMDAAARIVKAVQTDVGDVKIRLGVLEERLHPSNYITDEQAAEVQSAVAAVAMALTKRDPSKNHIPEHPRRAAPALQGQELQPDPCRAVCGRAGVPGDVGCGDGGRREHRIIAETQFRSIAATEEPTMPRFRKLSEAEIPANPPTLSARAQVAQAYDAHLAAFAIGEYGRAELIAGERRDTVRQRLQAAARRRGLALRFRPGPGLLTFRVEAALVVVARPAPPPAAGANQWSGGAARRDPVPPRPPRRQTAAERYHEVLPRWMREGQPPGRREGSNRRAR